MKTKKFKADVYERTLKRTLGSSMIMTFQDQQKLSKILPFHFAQKLVVKNTNETKTRIRNYRKGLSCYILTDIGLEKKVCKGAEMAPTAHYLAPPDFKF